MTTARKRKTKGRAAVARPAPKIDLAREVEIIAREFKRLQDDLHRAIGRGVDRAVALGKRLARCKKAAGHGKWLKEVVPALPFAHDKASHLIRLYELSERADPIKFRNVAKYASVTALSFLSAEGVGQIAEELKSGRINYLTVQSARERSKAQDIAIGDRQDPITGETLRVAAPVKPPQQPPKSVDPKPKEPKPKEPKPEAPASSPSHDPAPSAAAKSDPNIARHEAEEPAQDPEEPAAEKPAEEPADRRGDPEQLKKMAALKARGEVDTAILNADVGKRITAFRVWLESIAPDDFAAELSPKQQRALTHDTRIICEWLGKAVAAQRDAAKAADREMKRKLTNGGDSDAEREP